MLKILIVEDTEGVAKAIGTALRAQYIRSMGADCERANPMEFFTLTQLDELPAHRNDPVDIILLDLRLPPYTEHDTLQWLNDHAEEYPPIIAISGLDHADDGVGWELPAVRNGAMNFWHKAELETNHGAKRLIAKMQIAIEIRLRQKYLAERTHNAAST